MACSLTRMKKVYMTMPCWFNFSGSQEHASSENDVRMEVHTYYSVRFVFVQF